MPTRGVFLTAALLLGFSPQAVLAAAGWIAGCDQVARELRSVEIPVASLTVDNIDHMSEDQGAIDPAVSDPHDATAPLLFLTPRVVHILEDVFGDSGTPEVSPAERVRRIMLAANAALQATTEASPEPAAAGGDGSKDAVRDVDSAFLSGPMTETFYDVDALPRFQRQMYRTDI